MPLAYFLPKYWITWVGLAVMRAVELLPFPAQRQVGNAIGALLRHPALELSADRPPQYRPMPARVVCSPSARSCLTGIAAA